MTLAHTIGGPGGVEIELFLVALGFLAAAFFFRPSQAGGSARTMVFCLVIGVALLAGAVVVPRINPTTKARVEITSPQDGASVPSKEPVVLQVNLTGGSLATSPTATTGGHLHVFVDDIVQSMPSSERIRVTFEPGTHEVRIEYVSNQHLSFDPPITDTIMVDAG